MKFIRLFETNQLWGKNTELHFIINCDSYIYEFDAKITDVLIKIYDSKVLSFCNNEITLLYKGGDIDWLPKFL